MTAEHAITSPQRPGPYEGRGVDCIAALRPSAAELAVTAESPIVVLGDNPIPDELEPLIQRAQQAGWERKEAEAALRVLARELSGAQGTVFD